MKKRMFNASHLEGVLYEHDLQLKVTGENSKAPGTEFITGTISVATDDDMTNIVSTHYTYVTAKTSTGKDNASFSVLKDIIDGKIKTYMNDGDAAAKVRIDSAIGLNDFYTTDRQTGEDTLVSAKRNEGGFIHVAPTISDDEKQRNNFDVDIVITKVTQQEADESRNLPEKAIVHGYIFDFRNGVMPVDFSATNPGAISYFLGLENPTFTRVKGMQISETIVRKIEEESAFGDPSIREVKTSRKDWVITWAQGEPYVWDDETTITGKELSEAVAARETYLATVKKRSDDYKASRAQGNNAIASAKEEYNF